MKKIISLVIIIGMTFTLIGCKADYNNKDLENQQSAYTIMHNMLERN